ncbi:MAG: hypothetical protein H7A36_05890 [Chlamydiales bacterium]|nr:hypothetical protein [Chlamydiales bacterium]
MSQKILVAMQSESERSELEEVLSAYLSKGAEFLFAKDRSSALALLKTKKPAIVFLGSEFLEPEVDDWVQEGTHVILVRSVHEKEQHGEDFIDRPLRKDQVLEKCRETLESLQLSRTPPM